jgi:hypothetical protein
VPTLHLCVLYRSQNKQRLFPYTTLTDWLFITETESVYCAVRTGSLYIKQICVVFKGLITIFQRLVTDHYSFRNGSSLHAPHYLLKTHLTFIYFQVFLLVFWSDFARMLFCVLRAAYPADFAVLNFFHPNNTWLSVQILSLSLGLIQ